MLTPVGWVESITLMTKGLLDAKLVHCKPLPRYVRRIIHDTAQCHYQREEYRTSAERNLRFAELRAFPGIVRYSDVNVAGIMVYVVAWPLERFVDPSRGDNDKAINRNGEGMAAANREATGGRVPSPFTKKSPEIDINTTSIQLDDAGHGKLEKLGLESNSI